MSKDITDELIIREETSGYSFEKSKGNIEEVNKNTCTYKQTEIDYNSWQCSNCKCEWCFDEGSPKDYNTNFCPECGARIKNFIELKWEDF